MKLEFDGISIETERESNTNMFYKECDSISNDVETLSKLILSEIDGKESNYATFILQESFVSVLTAIVIDSLDDYKIRKEVIANLADLLKDNLLRTLDIKSGDILNES